MKTEQRPEDVTLEEQAEAFKTLLRGKKDEVQWFNPNNGWQSWPMDWSYVNFVAASKESPIRRKPQPKLRPWKPEEVPPHCLIRHPNWPKGNFNRIIEAINDKVWMTSLGCLKEYHNSELIAQGFVHSIDNGASWLPCGVEE